jgi:hypothetical protein
MVRVYVSLPLTGPSGSAGREVLRGVELALDSGHGEIELVVLDSAAEDRDLAAAANAHRAAGDAEALAYVGDFHSSQVVASAAILSAAGLLQVTPTATHWGLAGATLVRLAPHDTIGAKAMAAWLAEVGVERVLVVHDHDDDYGIPVGAMCVEAALDLGLGVRSRPVWDGRPPPEELDGVEALVYAGVAGSGAAAGWNGLHRDHPQLWLVGTDGVATDDLAGELSPGAAARARFFVPYRAGLEAYGHEAVSLVIESIEAAGGDRAAVVREARSPRERWSLLGAYTIDADGLTIRTTYGRLAVVAGRLAWDNAARFQRHLHG